MKDGSTSWARLFVGLALGAVFSGLWGGVAAAHASYKFSNPDDKTTVSQAPSEIWAEYTEPPSAASYLTVFDPCGEQVDNGDSRQQAYRVYVSMAADKAGTYRVEWFVDSELDNHPTRGTFTFSVTNGEPCPGAEEPEAKREPRQSASGDQRNGSDSSDGQASSQSGDTDDATDGTRSGSTGDRRSRGQDGRSDQRGRNNARGDRDPDGSLVAIDEPAPSEEPGLLSDIPISGLVIALTMTTAIGAAGGFIYAGIMGYHKVSD